MTQRDTVTSEEPIADMHDVDAPPEPQPQDEDLIDPELVLRYVREHAARRDPALSHLYAGMSPRRIKDAAYLAQQLLETHRELLGRQGRGARSGKRKHARRIYDLLNATNDGTLVLAIAYLETAIGTLPAS